MKKKHNYINAAHNWKQAKIYIDERDKRIEQNTQVGLLLIYRIFGSLGKFWLIAGPIVLFMGLLGALFMTKNKFIICLTILKFLRLIMILNEPFLF